MITDCNQNESILELASKLAIYAAENARKRQRETKDEIGKTFKAVEARIGSIEVIFTKLLGPTKLNLTINLALEMRTGFTHNSMR